MIGIMLKIFGDLAFLLISCRYKNKNNRRASKLMLYCRLIALFISFALIIT